MFALVAGPHDNDFKGCYGRLGYLLQVDYLATWRSGLLITML